MLLVQISDPHVTLRGTLFKRRVDTGLLLAQAVSTILALTPRPQAVLITGDLVDRGTAAEYDHLAERLAPLDAVMPVYLVPGNHDDREALAARFPHYAYLPAAGPLDYEVEVGAVRLICIDSLVPGAPHGRIGPERLAALDLRLAAAPDRPTVLAVHHPPFRSGIRHMDTMNLVDAGGLAEVVVRHPQVERVLCGHLHRAMVVRFAGTIAECCPSTAHQLELDLGSSGRPAAFSLEPPGLRLLAYAEGQGIVSHLVPCGPFPGPFLYSG